MKFNLGVLSAAALLALASSGAQAQAGAGGNSVTLYGLVDTGVEYLTNVGADGSSLTRMPGLTGSLPSRWGVRGSEDLGGGLRAVFTLESGFGVDTGTLNQGGRGFGRQAWVGLSGDWGTVTFGRNYTMLFWSLLDSDLTGPSAFGLASLDNYLPNDRVDNSLAYRGTFNGFTVGATYSFGRDAVNANSPSGTNCAGESATDSKACREWSVLLKYDTKTWGAAFAVDDMRGGPGAFAGLNNSNKTDRRTTLNGYVKLNPELKLAAGIIRRDNDGAGPASATNGITPRSNLVWIGGAWNAMSNLVVDAQLQRLKFSDGGSSSTLGVVRGTYSLSKRTAVYGTVGHMKNGSRLSYSVSSAAAGGAPAAGKGQTGVMVGLRHSF